MRSCVIWCVVLIIVAYTLFDWVKSIEWNKSKILKISRYFVYFQINSLKTRNCWKSAYLGHFTQILHEGILFIAWILILSHNENYIKVSENSVKNFLDTHAPLITKTDPLNTHIFIHFILLFWGMPMCFTNSENSNTFLNSQIMWFQTNWHLDTFIIMNNLFRLLYICMLNIFW